MLTVSCSSAHIGSLYLYIMYMFTYIHIDHDEIAFWNLMLFLRVW